MYNAIVYLIGTTGQQDGNAKKDDPRTDESRL